MSIIFTENVDSEVTIKEVDFSKTYNLKNKKNELPVLRGVRLKGGSPSAKGTSAKLNFILISEL